MRNTDLKRFYLILFLFCTQELQAQPLLRCTNCGGAVAPASNNLSLQLDITNTNTPLYPTRSVPTERVWYSAIWIFSDGNSITTSTIQGEEPTSMDVNYQFPPQVSWARAYLTEHYDNTTPPPLLSVLPVNTNTALSETNMPILADNGRSEQVLIYENNEPRPGYPVVYTFSFKYDQNPTGLFIFYNGKPGGTTWNVFGETTEHILPSYFGNASSIIEGTVADLNSSTSFKINGRRLKDTPFSGLNGKYQKYIFFPMDSLSANIGALIRASFNRKRIFTVLNTESNLVLDPNAANNHSSILAVLTSETGGDTIKVDEERLGVFFDGDPQITDSDRIIGLSELNSRVVASHDPNSLVLTKVTEKANKDVLLRFKLTICNDGVGNEYNPLIDLTDLTGMMKDPEVFVPKTGRTYNLAGNSPWALRDPDEELLLIPGVVHPYEPSCDSITIKMTVAAANVGSFAQNIDSLLQACITFSGDPSNTDCPIAVKDTAFFDPAKGVLKQPIPKEPCVCDLKCCLMIIGAVIIAIIAIVMYIIRRRNSPTP